MSKLSNEISGDPEAFGYAGMTVAQRLASINGLTRSQNRTSMSGDEVFQNMDSRATLDGLTEAQRRDFLDLCGRDSLDPFGAMNVELIKSIFGNTSATVNNLVAARIEAISRAQEIDIPFPVRIGEMEAV